MPDQLKAVTEEDANAFVGPLFPGKVVDELGIADGSLFIYGDDSEYTRRVSGKHKLYLIRDAVIDHQDAPVLDANMTPAGWWKEYYCNRNQYFMIREFQENKWCGGLASAADSETDGDYCKEQIKRIITGSAAS